MNNLNTIYERILKVLENISDHQLLAYQRRQPKLSDLELVSVSLTSEYLSIYSENDLFRKLPKSITDKIERSVYNRRRRRLADHLYVIRLKLASQFNEFEDCFIVDSMPLEVCKLSRNNRSKICRKHQYAYPNKCYCASQNSTYYGYKLHAVCSLRDVQSWDLSPASVHDINYFKDIKAQIKDCTLIGDKGYLTANIQLNLFESCNIKLNTPMRTNQHGYKKTAIPV